jgi:hypothetical protein
MAYRQKQKKSREYWKAVSYTNLVGKAVKFPTMVGIYPKNLTKTQVEKRARNTLVGDTIKVGRIKGANLKLHELIYGKNGKIQNKKRKGQT